MPQEDDLVSQVLKGHRFINPRAITIDAAGASPDYSKLFTLYQGLTALQGLAEKAQDDKISTNMLADVKRRFNAGMEEVTEYLGDTSFDHVALSQGTLTEKLKSTVGVPRTDTVYTADAIHTGSATTAVKAFEGDVQFSMSIKKIGTATPFTVNIDLNEMDPGTTRSMSNVVSFINTKLKEQGLFTKFEVNRTAAVPTTTVINGKTVTLSKGQESYGLKLKGVSYEAVTFSAASKSDSVFVMQSSGDSATKSTSTKKTGDTDTETKTATTPKVTAQLLKFQTDQNASGTTLAEPVSKVGDKYWVEGQSQQTAMPDTVANVRQSIAGPDGSVYVLADVNGQISNQDIKGTTDVALMKYDSAGNIVFTRTLGASDAASGYSMAVSADGKIAIAGSVTGALNISKTTVTTYGTAPKQTTSTTTIHEGTSGYDESVSDSFVSVYDPDGVEMWTQRKGGNGEDEATAVAFGADGSIYVGGRTRTSMPGATTAIKGGWDGYVMGFDAAGKSKFTVQTGTDKTDSISGLVVDGNTLYTSGIEDGSAVVKTFTLDATPATRTVKDANGVETIQNYTKYSATQSASRNLGGIGGGSISGMSLYNGKLYLGGSSGSDKLLETTGNVKSSYSGGYDAYALAIDANLGSTASDTIAYYGGAGVEKDAKVQFVNGKAWIAGSTTGAIAEDGNTDVDQIASGKTTAGTTKTDAYLTRLNLDAAPADVVEYQQRYTGKDGVVQPNAIAVSAGSSSVLDRLGLPMGTVMYKDSTAIVSGTSVRTGDQFAVVDPNSGLKRNITIDASETLESLAKKIVRASGYKLKVDVQKVTGKDFSQLNIQPANKSSKVEFVAGPAGRDALEGLGLEAGIVSADAKKPMDASANDYLESQKAMGLNYDTSLNLSSDASIAKAIESLKETIKNVQKVYNYLKYGDPQESDIKKKNNSSGVAPAYLTDQIKNYQAGLMRLGIST
nr:transcriptional regulator [Asticcacaulis solisilvae]